MRDVWTFTMLYLGMIAGVLGLLAAVIWYLANRRRRASFDELMADALAAGEPNVESPDWERRVERLEAKVDELLVALERARGSAEDLPKSGAGSLPVQEMPRDQASSLRECRRAVGNTSGGLPEAESTGGGSPCLSPGLHEQVCLGFRRGMTVTELARETGRGRGEVELIINLHRAAVADEQLPAAQQKYVN